MSHTRPDVGHKLALELLENRLTPDATSYVTSLYTNLLDRAPDPAGLAGWVSALNMGATTQQVATAIWRSQEHRTVEVTGYYFTLLHRAPDAAGLSGWVSLMVNGTLNEQGVEIAFVSSAEYINNHPTPLLYITGLYRDLLGRLPTLLEVGFWIPTLTLNGPVTVSAAIMTSGERFADVIDVYYELFLNRTPDTAGGLGWLNALQTNQATVESVAEGILSSAEYIAKH